MITKTSAKAQKALAELVFSGFFIPVTSGKICQLPTKLLVAALVLWYFQISIPTTNFSLRRKHMGGAAVKLTETAIRNLKLYANGKDRKLSDGGGLYLHVVAKSNTKLWRMAYRYDGKQKLLSIGPYPLVSLKEAREKREEAKKLLLDGIDPSAHKQAAKAARVAEVKNTFAANVKML